MCIGGHSNPIEMEINLDSLDLEQLTDLYNKANDELKQYLLNGSSWKEVKAKRDVVTEIAKELYRKKEALKDE